jgi:deazaflavin-dependent oxidoreductase (nitroreductase family)
MLSTMLRWMARLMGAIVLGGLVLMTVFFAGMRRKSPVVLDSVRRFNRAVTNPQVLKSAGSPGATAAVMRHVGRTSGRTYDTPVGPVATVDGFLIALPYGRRADWVRNVLANGSATLVHEGDTVAVERPEIVRTSDVLDELPPSEQRTLRWFAVDECLRVHRVEQPVTA